jgi:hypothetical protein
MAMMVLLRYLYGIPYPTTDPSDEDFSQASLQDHAQVFVVAEKYQISKLRRDYTLDFDDFACEDFALSLRAILAGTTLENTARKLMMKVCIAELRHLRFNDAFLALLPESPELAVEIIKHPYLELEHPGKWHCYGWDRFEGDSGGVPMCGLCGYNDEFAEARPFEKSFAWQRRKQDIWSCPYCLQDVQPLCSACHYQISWREPSY